MAIGGAFLGGGVELVPAGSCKLELEILTEDRANLTAKFTITGGGNTYTVTAGSDGRAIYTVPSGQTYTVSVNTTGYDNLANQTVIAESGTIRYVRFDAIKGRVLRSGDTMDGNLTIAKSTPVLYINATDSSKRSDIEFRGNNNRVGILRMYENYENSGFNYGILGLFKPSGSIVHNITLGFDGNGNPYNMGLTPSSKTDNSGKIATTAWVNQTDFLVHRYGAETIAGAKTFTDNISISADGERGTLIYRNKPIGGSWNRYKWDRCFGKFTDSSGNVSNQVVGQILVVNDAIATTHQIIANNYKADGTQISATISLYAYPDGTTYAKAPTTPTDATSNEIATANWSLGKFVKRTGDTMIGTLTLAQYTPVLHLKTTDNRVTTESASGTSGRYFSISWLGYDDEERAKVSYRALQTGASTVGFGLWDNAHTVSGDLYLQIDNTSKEVCAIAPSPSSKTDNSGKIATTAWVNQTDFLVHRYGAETIAGAKTFSDNVTIESTSERGLLMKRDKLIGVEWARYNWERMFGKYTNPNSGTTGYVYIGQQLLINDDIGTAHSLIANNYKEDGTSVEGTISVVARKDGTTYARCPTTPSSATSNEVATANWVNTKLDTKQDTITLTANRALISNSSGKVAVSAVTSTELGYLDGVTSSIQTQLNGKAASSHTHDDRYYTESEINTLLANKNKITEFSSYAELITLIQNGKRGDSFGITIDYTGGSNISDLIDTVPHHAFGHYTIDEKTISNGTMTKFEAFGSGEVQISMEDSTKYFHSTGFGRLPFTSEASLDGFRGFYKGIFGYCFLNAAVQEEAVTSCTGYYISI